MEETRAAGGETPLRIVLCDDHGLFREALAGVLRARGHEVWEDASPLTVAAEVRRVDPDVCVLDISFPEGNGIDAAREISRSGVRARVLMLSATDDPAAVAEAVAAGATGFTRKDQHVSRLIEAISAVATGRRSLVEVPAPGGPARRPRSETAVRLEQLTERERDVLAAIVRAETTKQMAARYGIAPSTARTHVTNILMKLGVHTRLQAVSVATAAGLVGLDGAVRDVDGRRGTRTG